jgi:cardiolipin synthase C
MIRTILPVVLVLLSACTQLPPRPELPVAAAPAVGQGTRLDSLAGSLEARNPRASGFRLLVDGPEAFALRMASASLAGRSLDVQTYIWHADTTGLALAQALLDAADRGVKVRLLLDDMDARAKNIGLWALAAHSDIEVRMFNPLASRAGALPFVGDFLGSGWRLNHRMHNKTWIADNRIAIVGGRNLGDEYFGADEEVNFVDLDFAMVGPVVRDASASFDRYWNSPASYPIETLNPEGVDAATAARLEAELKQAATEARSGDYAALLRRDDAVQRLVAGDWPMIWTRSYSFVSDDPLKALRQPGLDKSDVLTSLLAAMDDANKSLTLISPYFVPGEEGTAGLVRRADELDSVRILTNSLAANDVSAVHGGYSRYRKELVEGGVLLWELKPLHGSQMRADASDSNRASLHTKAISIDGKHIFVGSYNLDPRSTLLNSEQGVLVSSRTLARQLEAIFERQTDSERAWMVLLEDGELVWTDGAVDFESDPMTSSGQRLRAWMGRVLPIESQL